MCVWTCMIVNLMFDEYPSVLSLFSPQYPDSRHPDSRHPDSRHPDSRYPDSRHPEATRREPSTQ